MNAKLMLAVGSFQECNLAGNWDPELGLFNGVHRGVM